jgi:hypothetical protein
MYIQYMYAVQVHMSTGGKDEVVSPLTPRKYTVLNGNFVLDLRDIFGNVTLV